MTVLYNDYNTHLRSKYGCRVYRIGLDAGFSCPNRDGTKGFSGCLYCNDAGSRAPYAGTGVNVTEQLRSRIEFLKNSKGAEKFIAYFQAFTNTHAPVERLKALYDCVLPFNDIVGISIGTRPDTVDREKLELISSYKNRYEVWIEYGLQSVHNKTLRNIKRVHTFEDFKEALALTKGFGIPACCHVILGLPGETKDDIMKTAKMLTDLKIDAIKIHLLHVLRGSELEKLYVEGKVKLMEEPEYVELVCDFLENLSPKIIIQRLTGQGDRSSHIAPAWALDKHNTIDRVGETLKKRGTCQGSGCTTASIS